MKKEIKKGLATAAIFMILVAAVGCSGSKTTDETGSNGDTAVNTETEVDSGAAEDTGGSEDTGSQAEEEGSTSADGALVGFCANATSSSFVSWMAEATKELLEADGAEVQIADADMDTAAQISQIENFAVMGAKVIIIIPVDPDSLADSISYAQEKGSLVFVLNSDTGVYDCLMTSDRYEIGAQTAQLTADWIDETFPDAADGSVKVAIFESRTNPEESADSDGMHEIEERCPKAKVVKTVDGISTNETAQEAISTLLQTNPEVQAVICYNSESCLGANEYVMSSGVVSDLSKFAVFGADYSDQVAQEIYLSTTDESVYRGTVKFGSDNIPQSIYDIAIKMIKGEDFPKNQW
ncbi:MAG TPA: sugar ABC transporter substrate-binding protein, partial [Lachnospiraceae bacterium]|nr:sugar ABC transporter substrate-binding protein [Lachnospiraceae bacterium]